MAQTWTDNTYELNHVGTTDLQNIKDNFAALKGLFSGGSAPSGQVAGMPWFDTTNKLLKIRNQANSAWLGIMYGGVTNKIWMYLNAATDGWAVDAAVTDRVLSLKGGTSTYNVNGGQGAGSWTQTNHTHTGPSHTHTGAAHTHTITHTHSVSYLSWGAANVGGSGRLRTGTADSSDTVATGDKTTSASSAANTGAAAAANTGASGTAATGASATINTWRPLAAVGTLQYPNI